MSNFRGGDAPSSAAGGQRDDDVPDRVGGLDAPARLRGHVSAGTRVLLLGATGRLGTAIKAALSFARRAGTADAAQPPSLELFSPPREMLRLQPQKPREAAERWLDTWKPHVVVNCIAISDVDRCEIEPVAAMQINAHLPGALAYAAARTNARLIHFSTDFVFDGRLRRPYREDDPPAPLSVYGESKLSGENAVASENAPHWIFRVSWLYGGAERNLAATLLDPENAQRPIALAADRIGVPNPVQLLAREVAVAITGSDSERSPPTGVYHLSCRGQTTWHDFGREFIARAIAAGRIAPESAPSIEAMTESTAGRAARRPSWSVLDPSRYENAFRCSLPDWREAIDFALQRTE